MTGDNRSRKVFVYGTHYWRPPNPPRDQHRYHLTKIKNELGFDLVKFLVSWNWHHRRPNEFQFDEIHEMFDICDELDLNVLLQLNLETAPYWLEAENPEARYVNANGRAIELGAQEAAPVGGHPGLCFHHHAVMHHAERYFREIVRQFKGRKSLYAYDCWNEPHLEPVWCNNMWGNKGDKVYCYCDCVAPRLPPVVAETVWGYRHIQSHLGTGVHNFRPRQSADPERPLCRLARLVSILDGRASRFHALAGQGR